MKKTGKKLILLPLCLLLMLLLSVQVMALESVNTGAACTLDVVFAPEGVKASNVRFDIYRIADVAANGTLTATGSYAVGSIPTLLVNPTAGNLNLVSNTVAGMIDADTSLKPAKSARTDAQGIAHFTALTPGLYFIDGEVYHGTNAYYTPHSSVIRIPAATEKGSWLDDVTMNVKWEKRTDSLPMSLQVLKVWSDSATNYHTTDSVTIELYKNGSLYDAQLLTKTNSWTHTWLNLDSSAKWTIKEKSVSGYTGTVERKGDCFVITNSPTNPPSQTSKKLPQTGLLWWPVPILAVLGVVFIAIGLSAKRRRNMYGTR